MSSRLLKSVHVIAGGGTKVVGIPKLQPVLEEEIAPTHTPDAYDFEYELKKQRELAEAELAEWRKAEEERFLLELEEAKRRGYQEGYEFGIEDGRQHASAHYAAQLQKAAEILELAYQEKAALIREAEPFVLELTVDIAKKVLKQELKSNPEAIIQLIRQTLASVYESESVSIGVSPEDFPFVQKQRQQLLAVDNGQVEVKVYPDHSIEQGGCIIRTSSGSIDARLDMQLSEIKKVLLSFQQGAAGE